MLLEKVISATTTRCIPWLSENNLKFLTLTGDMILTILNKNNWHSSCRPAYIYFCSKVNLLESVNYLN